MHKFALRRRLGCGGGGDAWLAEGEGGPCVLKCVLLAGLPKLRRRAALREVHVLRRLEHPNVLRIFDAFVHEQHLVVASELCDAGDLHKLITQRRLATVSESPPGCRVGFSEAGICVQREPAPAAVKWKASVLAVFSQIARGLHYIHAQGVTHRDLKSDNVFLTMRGLVKVADFGVAAFRASPLGELSAGAAACGAGGGADTGSATPQAVGAQVVGCMQHLPPEVCDGRKHEAAGDLWQLGLILHELCTLELPFSGVNALAVVLRIVEGKVQPLPSVYSYGLQELHRGLLSPEASARPTAAGVLASPVVRHVQREPALGASAGEIFLPACHRERPRCMEDVFRCLEEGQPFARLYGPAEFERFVMRQLEYGDELDT